MLDATAEAETPVFLRIARAISDDIARGRLHPNTRMPSTRALATQAGVHRNTAVAAYRELVNQGWLTSEPARGTFVNADINASRRNPASDHVHGDQAGYALRSWSELGLDDSVRQRADPAVERNPRYLLSGGRPDPRLVSSDLLARAYRRALRTEGRRVLDYGSPYGHPRLRRAIADMLVSVRALPISWHEILITRGSQMALHLVFAALLRPGQRVAVEAYGYAPAWAAMRQAGGELCPVEVDADGMCVHDLEAMHRRQPLRAVYLTPHHQYPTMVALSPARRLWLLDFARREGIAIVEDDYDHEFHYEGRPVLPLASRDPSRQVIYIGSLSKVFAPGLRIGYVVAPPPLLQALAGLRACVDRQGDLAVELALAELMEDGELQRHVWRTRRTYQNRRDAFVRALSRHLGEVLQVEVPAGGLAMWTRVADGIDAVAWAEAALARGARIVPGQRLRIDGRSSPFLRLGFTRHTERELAAGVRVLRSALDDL